MTPRTVRSWISSGFSSTSARKPSSSRTTFSVSLRTQLALEAEERAIPMQQRERFAGPQLVEPGS